MGNWDLNGKKALITGASKGIGKAINEEFMRLGAETFIVSRDAELIAGLVETYSKKGMKCSGLAADLGEKEGLEHLVEKLRSDWDSLDILVNNVGMNIRKSTAEYELEDLRKIMSVNVESAFLLNKNLYPMLKKSGNASVIHISSVASLKIVGTSTAAYHMSKGALDQLNNFLSVEWGRQNIRVNSIHPWYIATPLAREILKDEAKKKKIVDATPLRRVGQPDEVARVAAFLAMEASSYVSGANIPVDGAFSKVGLMT